MVPGYIFPKMEHFSRECLEIDQQESRKADIYTSASMDRVYDRAAKLVKRTLDVEEVLVMDVSHCDVLETLNSEATVSVVMHHGTSTRATSRTLTADEQNKLNAFFNQYPEGKISEGILPVCFRPFIPTHIQYALSGSSFQLLAERVSVFPKLSLSSTSTNGRSHSYAHIMHAILRGAL